MTASASPKPIGTRRQALVATLDKFKVPEKEKAEVLAAATLKKDIVEK